MYSQRFMINRIVPYATRMFDGRYENDSITSITCFSIVSDHFDKLLYLAT